MCVAAPFPALTAPNVTIAAARASSNATMAARRLRQLPR